MAIHTYARRLGILCLLASVVGATPAAADAIADFYKGRTVTIYVGFGAGGGFDLYARQIATRYGKHIPGNPAVVVKNMPGAGSAKAAAYLANATAQDGTSLGMFLDTLTLATLIRPQRKFNMAKFVWIGRVAPVAKVAFLWHTAPARSVRDAVGKKITISANDPTSAAAMIPLVLNGIVGTRFQPVVGYRGATAMALAAERGETDGAGAIGIESIETMHPDWLRDRKINVLYIASAKRIRQLPNIPALTEFARNGNDRRLLAALGSGTDIGRALAAEPRIPPERATALRRAFDALVADPAYLAESKKRKLDVDPMDGKSLQKLVSEVMAMPKPLVNGLKAAIGKKKKKK